MDKDTIKGILARYNPPLSPSQIDEIAEAVVFEHVKTVKKLQAERETVESSQSSRVTVSSRGRTQVKAKK